GGVLDGLTAAQLGVVGGQEDRAAAELGHARLEGYPGAGRGLLEDHAEHLAVEGLARAAGSVLGLEGDGPLDNSLELGGGEVLEGEKVSHGHGASPLLEVECRGAQVLAKARISGARVATSSSPSSSPRVRGGNRRTTFSAVTLINRPASAACCTRSAQGRSSSMPIIRPWPRISRTAAQP